MGAAFLWALGLTSARRRSTQWLASRAIADDHALHSWHDLADILGCNEDRPRPKESPANEKRSRTSPVAVENVLDDPEAFSTSLDPETVAGSQPVRASVVPQCSASLRYLFLGVT